MIEHLLLLDAKLLELIKDRLGNCFRPNIEMTAAFIEDSIAHRNTDGTIWSTCDEAQCVFTTHHHILRH